MNGKLVIFDLDGTLLNTIGDLAHAANHCLESHGLPCHDELEYKRMAGHGMRHLVTAALPEKHREPHFIDGFLSEFLEYYLENIDRRTFPYPGIPELLESLQDEGFSIAVASNKIQDGAEKLMKRFFPDIRFSGIMGNRAGLPLKPDAAVVRLLMDKAAVSPEAAIMVGDSPTDIQTARNAGIDCIAVSWGFRSYDELSGAGAIVGTAGELGAAIREHRWKSGAI